MLRQLAPRVKIYAAEVETAAPLAASLAAGEPRTVDYTPSFVDGIGSKMVFANMFEHAQRLLDGSIVVTLEEAAQRHEVGGGAQSRDRGRRVRLRDCGRHVGARRRRAGWWRSSPAEISIWRNLRNSRRRPGVWNRYEAAAGGVSGRAAPASGLSAQAPAPIRVEVSLVNVGFSVRDAEGQPGHQPDAGRFRNHRRRRAAEDLLLRPQHRRAADPRD